MERSEITGKINNRYILIGEADDTCSLTDLGQMCKAHDIQRDPASARYVALLLLHEWCRQLPPDILSDLRRDVEGVIAIAQEMTAVRAILDADLPRSTSAAEQAQGAADASPSSSAATEARSNGTYYIALSWVTSVETPAQLFGQGLHSVEGAVEFVRRLSEQLGKLYLCTHYLRPVIAIEKLAFLERSNGGSAPLNGTPQVALGDLGFDNYLDRPLRDQDDEHNDVRALTTLLVQLLDGILKAHGESPAPIQAWRDLRTDLDEVQAAYTALAPQNPGDQDAAPALWSVLRDPLLADFASFAARLKSSTLPHLSPPKLPVETQSSKAESAASTAQPPVIVRVNEDERRPAGQFVDKRDDKLVIRFIEDNREEYVLHQRLNDEIVRLGEFEDISIDEEAGRLKGLNASEQESRRKQISAQLMRRRVYIKYCHNEGTGTEYYTITDLDSPSAAAPTKLNGQPLSPLFAALLTNRSTIEISPVMRVSLDSAIRGHAAGWIVALDEKVEVLEVLAPSRRLIVEPQVTSVTLPLKLMNPTGRIELLAIFVDGMPPDWPVANPVNVRLFAKETAEKSFSLALPSVRLAGEYPLVVRLVSDNIGAQVATQAFCLVVPPQLEFAAALQPESVRSGHYGELQLQNAGNFSREFSILWRDSAGELRFEPAQTIVTLPPFYTGAISYRTRVPLRARRLIGTAKRHDIRVVVAARPQTQGAPQTVPGQVISPPLIPLWAPLLAAALFILYMLLFPPGFANRGVQVNGSEVATAHAGNELLLQWRALNTCLYSVLRNGELIVPLRVNGAANQEIIANPRAGDQIEVQLRGCSLVRTLDWVVEVGDAPLAPPPPPQLVALSLHTMNVESHGPATGGPNSQAPAENQPILLLGQTGDLCVRWELAQMYAESGYTVRLVTEPKVDAIEQNGLIEAAAGDKCFPIAATFRDANEDFTQPQSYFIRLAATNTATGEETVFAETKVVQVFKPYCWINAGASLWIREGPGRDFPARGELNPREAVFPLNSPLRLNDQNDNLYWTSLLIRDDPRPGWIAYDYLNCPVPIHVLPVAGQVPLTPTPIASPTPTPTPLPTATPQPTPAPTVAVEPRIINANDCALLKWSIQGVKEVYLNGEGVAGEAERQVCPTQPGEITYTWTIFANDGGVTEKSVILRVNGPLSEPTPAE